MLFLDTNILLTLQNKVFEGDEKFYLSSVTIDELENIKTSFNKDEDIKYRARTILHLLEDNQEKYEIILYHNAYLDDIASFDLAITPDLKIIACAYHLAFKENKSILFTSNDLAARMIASTLGLSVCSGLQNEVDKYCGYKLIQLTEEELANFYSVEYIDRTNKFKLLVNEYLLLQCGNRIVDKYKWNGEEYINIPYYTFDSKLFGKVCPKDGDIYQQLALDSLNHNQLTVLRGPAGSGKSYLAVGYMLSLLEKGKIDKIIIFCNTVATRGSAKLGYYPGTRTEKILDSQIGNFLISKLGDRIMVEKMIEDGQLLLLPISDIRGFDTSGMNAAVYITEAQNLDRELIKLSLQRIGDDSICILDGDDFAQVDLQMYAGENNGLKRVSKIFRGQDFYGEVTLKTIKRGRIATIAQSI